MSDFITSAELRIEAEKLCDENDKLRQLSQELYERETMLEAIVWEMLDCIQSSEDVWGYTRYFAEKIEGIGIAIPSKGDVDE